MISCRQPSPPSHLLSFIQAQAHPATPFPDQGYQRSRVEVLRTRAHNPLPRNHSHLLPAMENNTAVSEAALRASIVERLNAVHVDITDMSGSFLPQHGITTTQLIYTHNNTLSGGCGQAFSTLIVSPNFAGLNSLKRHRLGQWLSGRALGRPVFVNTQILQSIPP